MGASGGPKIKTSGLLFAIDAQSKHHISGIGCEGFNGSPQLLKNLVNHSDTITTNNGVRLGNLTYYTVFAIDYPEGNFGGSAAGRDGIQQGFNVTSGTRTRNYTRALNYAVWNDGSWIGTSYFNGSRDSGHCYDSYSWGGTGGAAAQVAQFVTDYNNIKTLFPGAVHIVAGSHRDRTHGNDKCDVLKDLGAPSNVSSLLDSAPEWIVVGKPGLGAGNAYAWAFENYSTDPTRVAHVNFGVPLFGDWKNNYLVFDGTDDYLGLPNVLSASQTALTIEFVAEIDSSSSTATTIIKCGSAANSQEVNIHLPWSNNNVYWDCGTGSTTSYDRINTTMPANAYTGYHHWMFTKDSSTGEMKIYFDGRLHHSGTGKTKTIRPITDDPISFGRYNAVSGHYWGGKVKYLRIYNEALTSKDHKSNYRSIRSRFGLRQI